MGYGGKLIGIKTHAQASMYFIAILDIGIGNRSAAPSTLPTGGKGVKRFMRTLRSRPGPYGLCLRRDGH